MFEIVHIGIPTTQSKEGETYVPGAERFVTPPEKSPSPWNTSGSSRDGFPEAMHYDVHVAAKVDSIEKYAAPADETHRPRRWMEEPAGSASSGRTAPSSSSWRRNSGAGTESSLRPKGLSGG